MGKTLKITFASLSRKSDEKEKKKTKTRMAIAKLFAFHANAIKQKDINTKKTCVSQVRSVNFNVVKKINTFKRKILDGADFICIVCNRRLYKRSVVDYKEGKCNIFVCRRVVYRC